MDNDDRLENVTTHTDVDRGLFFTYREIIFFHGVKLFLKGQCHENCF